LTGRCAGGISLPSGWKLQIQSLLAKYQLFPNDIRPKVKDNKVYEGTVLSEVQSFGKEPGQIDCTQTLSWR